MRVWCLLRCGEVRCYSAEARATVASCISILSCNYMCRLNCTISVKIQLQFVAFKTSHMHVLSTERTNTVSICNFSVMSICNTGHLSERIVPALVSRKPNFYVLLLILMLYHTSVCFTNNFDWLIDWLITDSVVLHGPKATPFIFSPQRFETAFHFVVDNTWMCEMIFVRVSKPTASILNICYDALLHGVKLNDK